MKFSSLFRKKKASNQKDDQKKPFFNQTNDASIQKKEQEAIQRASIQEEDELGTNTQRIEEDKAIQEKVIQKMGEEEEPVQMMGQEEEEGVQMQSMEEEEPIQAQSMEEEEPIQTEQKDNSQSKKKLLTLEQLLAESKGQGFPLPKELRANMEAEMNCDFSKVRIHTGEYATTMTQMLNAYAFTNGYDIYFNEGQYQPETDRGVELLAHELTHVIQQKG